MNTKPIASKNKQARKRIYTNKDLTLLHFMFINDAIMDLRQPPLISRGKVLGVDDNKIKAVVKRDSSASGQREEIEVLRKQVNEYVRTIDRIHKIANYAIDRFDSVDVGGRKPLVLNGLAKEVANEYFTLNSKFPTAKKLLDLVCERSFKQDPQTYIDHVSKRMKQEEVATNRVDPAWWYWKKAPRPCSESTMRNILKELRQERKIFA